VIAHLNGVMTNPNCEYGANFVAIHTLAQWAKCRVDGGAAADNADVRLEMSSDASAEEEAAAAAADELAGGGHSGAAAAPPQLSSGVYHPHNALYAAVIDWIPEFAKQKTVWGPMSKPQVGLTAPTIIPSVVTGEVWVMELYFPRNDLVFV